MKRTLSLLVVLFLATGCVETDDFIPSRIFDELNDEEEYYECYSGNARLPFGNHPECLITPEGYYWECDNTGELRFDSDGTLSTFLNTSAYFENQDYFSDCPGYASRRQTGEWVIDVQGRLCISNDTVQPGLYYCQRFTCDSNTLRSLGSVNFYEDGTLVASQYESETCTLTEE